MVVVTFWTKNMWKKNLIDELNFIYTIFLDFILFLLSENGSNVVLNFIYNINKTKCLFQINSIVRMYIY